MNSSPRSTCAVAPHDEVPLPDNGALYDRAACGLLLTDAEGAILRANLTLCDWLGAEPGQLRGKRFQDLLTMGGRIFHQTHWMPLLQMQGSLAEVKLELLCGDGRHIPVVVNALRREHAGRVLHELALFVARDRHAYENELLRERKQAEGLLAARAAEQRLANDKALLAEQMIAIVSHDLRNPLATIMLGAASMGTPDLPKKSQRYLGYIVESAQRARRLVEDLLDFTMARVGSGISVQRTPMDLHAMVARCVEELAGAWPHHVLQHRSEGTGECTADAQRLFQVIGNLVGNAATYGDPDSPIVVTSRIEADKCSISVHNRGNPIPPELLPTLFEAMVRGRDDASPARNVGLGLYIVREIARAHGGDVTVVSNPEEGTTFTFAF